MVDLKHFSLFCSLFTTQGSQPPLCPICMAFIVNPKGPLLVMEGSTCCDMERYGAPRDSQLVEGSCQWLGAWLDGFASGQ